MRDLADHLLKNKNALMQLAPVPLRIVMGVGFIVHGWAKWSRGPAGFAKLLQQVGVPLPDFTAWAVTFLELAGGFALIIGAFVAIVSIPLIVSMFVAMITVNGRYGFSAIKTIGLNENGPVFGPPGYEINLLYIAGLLVLVLIGAGPLSIDRLWKSISPAK
ncbi:MAG TPA: DoxX family protein [Pirellulales bacterium]